jgi:hypothetical protein
VPKTVSQPRRKQEQKIMRLCCVAISLALWKVGRPKARMSSQKMTGPTGTDRESLLSVPPGPNNAYALSYRHGPSSGSRHGTG